MSANDNKITPTMKKWLQHIARGGKFNYIGNRMSLVNTSDGSVTLPTVERMERAGLILWERRENVGSMPTHVAVLTDAGKAGAA